MKPFLTPAAVVMLNLLLGLTTPWSIATAAPPQANLVGAVVWMPSHGGSATVIFTEKDRTYLLSCGHCFQGGDRSKPVKLDIPAARPDPNPIQVGVTVVEVDHELDLSLLCLNAGPVDYVCPVAPDRFQLGRDRLLSVGYDEMRMPPMQVPTHVLFSDMGTTWTREMPWHGRSGGALIDLDAGYLIGVVSGYETTGAHRGIYASHDVICDFLHRCEGHGGQPTPPHTSKPLKRGYIAPMPFAPICGPQG